MSIALLIALMAKSSAIAGLGLALSLLIARRAADRVDVLRATIVLLLALPLFMAFGPALALALLPAVQPAGPPPPLWSGELQPVEGVTVSGALMQPSAGQWLTLAWSVGVLVVAVRFAAGIWALSSWSRAGRRVEAPAWLAALEQAAPGARPVLKCSDRIASPLAWGLPPGTVLIDPETLAKPHTAPAVMAHEMAHVRRGDWLFLLLARIALALFWFNPLVWLLHRSLIDRSEEAADAVAVAQVDRHAYARTLIGLAAGPGHPAATAMASDGRSLKRRIATLMTEKTSARRPAVVLVAVAALTAVATPIAALELRARCEDGTLASAVLQPMGTAPLAPLPATSAMAAVRSQAYAPAPPAPPAPPASPAGLIEMVSWEAPPAPPAPPALPAPPAPPAPPSWDALSPPPPPPPPPAPPAPPAPPVPSQYGRHVVVHNGVLLSDLSPADRARHEEALQAAAEARQAAAEARIHAAQRRSEAAAIRASADQARAGAVRARALGLAQAAEGRRVAERARLDARVHMRNGAVQMRRGAEQMRQESRRLGEPAYRARQIRENAERGNTVTDAELRALAPRLRDRAADLERRADELAARGE